MSELPPPTVTPETLEPVPVGTSRARVRPGLVAVVVVAGLAGWAVAGHDAGGSPGDDTVAFELQWDRRVPSLGRYDGFAGVQLLGTADDLVVFADGFGGDRSGVVAVDASQGEQVWDAELELGDQQQMVAALVGDVVLAARFDPEADTDVALTALLTAFDLSTGDERWTVDGLLAPQAWLPYGDTVFVVVAGGSDSDRALIAVDAASGETRWERADATMPLVARPNGLVVPSFVGDDPSLVGLAPDGTERWTFDAPSDGGPGFDWSTEIEGDTVMLPDGGDVVGIDLESGAEAWRTQVADGDEVDVRLFSRPALDVDVVCVEHDDEITVAAVERGTGAVRWDETLGPDDAGVAGVTDSTIVVLGEGTPFGGCIGPATSPIGDVSGRSVADGREVWAFERGEGGFGFLFATTATWPVRVDALTVERDGDRQAAIDLATGEELASVPLVDGPNPTVSVRQYGDLLVGLRLADDTTSTVFDPLDDTRSVDVGDMGNPLGVAGGVLYVRSGSRIIAVD